MEPGGLLFWKSWLVFKPELTAAERAAWVRILALRQQLAVYQRTLLRNRDRLLTWFEKPALTVKILVLPLKSKRAHP